MELSKYMASGSAKKKVVGGRDSGQVLDGSDTIELVGNEEVFSSFVDHKSQELDRVCDGKLSVKELEPAVAYIGAALGLAARGISADSDHIYFEVLNEFTHGKQEQVSKTEFKEVHSDILLGMAAGLKRDPIVILRIDGEDLRESIKQTRECLSKFGFTPRICLRRNRLERSQMACMASLGYLGHFFLWKRA